jgi:hypothetical protein
MVVWKEGGGALIGDFLQSPTGREGRLSVRRDRSTECEGDWRITDSLRGSWSLDCTDGNAVTGTFRMEGNVSRGTGTDARCRPVTFTIRWPPAGPEPTVPPELRLFRARIPHYGVRAVRGLDGPAPRHRKTETA